MSNPLKKLVFIILTFFGFGTSLMFLQNHATNPKYLVPVQVRITAKTPLLRAPEFLKLNITDDYDDAKEVFQLRGLEYSFSSSRIMKSFALRLANQDEVSKISLIQVSLGDRAFTYDGKDISAHWGLRAEKETVLLELKDRLQYSKSLLSLISSRYSVMNWPGDKALILRFFQDKPWIFLLPFTLLFLSLLIIFLEVPLRRLFDRGLLARSPVSPWARSLVLFCLFFLLSLLIRFPTLSQTTSMDEGTFITIGDRIAKGATLYRDVWDPKSPGFFFYYSLVLSLFHSLFMVKLVGLIVTSLTALVLSWIMTRVVADRLRVTPVLAGVTYVLISSIADPNFCINPEQLVVMFSGIAILMILRDDLLSIFLAGLFLGLSFISKYPAGLDLAAVGILWLVFSLRKGRSPVSLLPSAGLAIVGFLVPSLMVVLFFYFHGTLNEFLRGNLFFDLTSYSQRLTTQGVLSNIGLFFKGFWPFAILGLIGLVSLLRSSSWRKMAVIAGFWGLSSLATILLPSQRNMNYWFQLWGALSLIIPFGIIEVLRWFGDVPASQSRFSSALAVVSMVAVLLVTASAWMQFTRENYPWEIAQALSGRIKPQDQIFILPPSAQVAYFYLGKMPPSKYVHGFGRPDAEMQRVFNLRPRFFVTTEDYDFKQQWEMEFSRFHLFYRSGSFEVFEHNQM